MKHVQPPKNIFILCTYSSMGKEFGSSGHHSLGEALFVSFILILSRFFKSNLFGLCPISDTRSQRWFLNARKPQMMSFHQRT